MNPYVFVGSAHPTLGEMVCQRLGIAPARHHLERYPDGEIGVELIDSPRGADAFVLQSTGPPGEAKLIELLLTADACRRSGAARVTGVIPYFAYARQDRRAGGRGAIGARVMADLLSRTFDRVIAVDLHDARLEGFFSVPLEHLSAVPHLAHAVREIVDDRTIVVAPDLGAAKLATRYALLLGGISIAIVHKMRLDGEDVTAERVIGDVANRAPLIVDDMVSTGGTVEAAARVLAQLGSRAPVAIVATHALLVGRALERLGPLPIRTMTVTDTVPPPGTTALPLEVVSIAPLLADAIDRIAHDRSLEDLRVGH